MITEFNRETLALLRKDIEAALAAVSEKHGITLGIGDITFSHGGVDFRTTLTGVTHAATGIASAHPDVDPKWAAEFLKICTLMGFKKEDLGAKFHCQGEEVTLVGLRPKARLKMVALRPNNKLIAVHKDDLKRIEAVAA